jgi:hypothetical protein
MSDGTIIEAQLPRLETQHRLDVCFGSTLFPECLEDWIDEDNARDKNFTRGMLSRMLASSAVIPVQPRNLWFRCRQRFQPRIAFFNHAELYAPGGINPYRPQ